MERRYCLNCMNPIQAGQPCPNCGPAEGTYVPADHQLPPGTVLGGRYLVGRVLGEGGFGITYLGFDLRLELRVAIKEYYPTNQVNRFSDRSLSVEKRSGSLGEGFEGGRERFLQEARVMARMDKMPQIVSVRDFFQENNTAYIVMEYVDGTTFKELVVQRGGRISASELLPMVEPLFPALSAMHAQDLIHRDISPDNIMLEKGHVRLLDFGCAREAAQGSKTMTVMLKHGYSPIEQYQHKGQGPWTDVYGLAATLYYCLTGTTPPQSLDRICGDELIPPRQLGADLTPAQERAILRGMGIRRDQRYGTVEEFHAALYQGAEIPPAPEPVMRGDATVVLEAEPVIPEPEPAPVESEQSTPRTVYTAPRPSEGRTDHPTEEQREQEAQRRQSKIWLGIGVGAVAAVLLLVLLTWRPWNVIARGEAGPSVTWTLSDTGVLTLSGSGKMYDYDEKNPPWESRKDKITSAIVEPGVTRIGNSAFSWCTNLASVTLPEGVTAIGNSAFFRCTSLTSITLPEDVSSIGGSAFSTCTSLTSITLPEGVTAIGNNSFFRCTSLTSITLPKGATQINDYAFYLCTGLTSITLPEGVTQIGAGAFLNCDSLTDVYYGGTEAQWRSIWIGTGNDDLLNAEIHFGAAPTEPEPENVIARGEAGPSVTWTLSDTGVLTISGSGEMDDYHVEGRSIPWEDHKEKITSAVVEPGVTKIGSDAFLGCTRLTGITLPEGVSSIGYAAFSNCTSLASVTLPEGMTEIGDNVFEDCISLTSVTLSEDVTYIASCAFYGCTSLTSVTLPEGVTEIGSLAFCGCSSLTSVTIPNSVTEIGGSAFSSTPWLSSLGDFPVVNDILLGYQGDGGVVTIPDNVTQICEWAFFESNGLTSVTIPNSVTEISWCAFSCCTSLTSVTIPNSVTKIDDGAFEECSNLTDVYYGGTEAQWRNIEIGDYNDSLQNAAIHFSSSGPAATSAYGPG